MSIGLLVLFLLFAVLVILAVRWKLDFGLIIARFIEQFAILVPRMLCALVAAGFIAELIPKELVSSHLGEDAGLTALPVAALMGLMIPAGPVIAFSIAAVFARSGASTAALVTFITAWSLFAAHRILIYEVPLLGPSFLRFRAISVVCIPFVAGLLAYMIGLATGFGEAIPIH